MKTGWRMAKEGKIQSIERAIAVLNCFQRHTSLGVTELSTLLQLNKSTVFGIVRTLADEQFLTQSPETGKYQLGPALLRLGNLVDTDLRRICQPYLTKLSAQMEETTNLVLPNGGDVVYIEKKESPQSVRICTEIGKSLPMYCTATGKAILAFLPPAQQEQTITAMQFFPFTRNTILDLQSLRAALEEVRSAGYAMDREEWEMGLVCVSAPIFNSVRQPVAAISCSGPKQRMTEAKLETAAQLLLRAAGEISGQL